MALLGLLLGLAATRIYDRKGPERRSASTVGNQWAPIGADRGSVGADSEVRKRPRRAP
ncbi:hypothetical protein ACWF99_12260 [Nocardia sp. NPDC055002]